MKYFKIYSGYNDPNPISIDETELQRAIYAQITGKVALLKNATIAGSSISKILPDFDKDKRKEYNPEVGSYLPSRFKAEYFLELENAGEVVRAKMENRPPQLKEPPVRIHTQGPVAIGELIEKKK